ncbi:putative mucin TcMUCII [Trypanosoma cruzi]|nr:putative mucin TcMUCII [Trypanosoma cruzi]
MMTCRLLCALLVLALCCCPSVGAGDTQPEGDVQASSKTTTTSTTQPPVLKEKAGPKPNVGDVPPPPPSDPSQGTAGQPGMQSNGSAEQPRNNAGYGGSPTVTVPQVNAEPIEVQTDDKDSKTETTRSTSTSSGKIVKDAEDTSGTKPPTTTTTTTKPPTTTTTTTTKAPTTTTTTTAPEAPSNTTKEAPAVSTTRAPSRLREIDGSLSSFAWVCAPLVLAASALAYTAVG